jgi:peptidoglycan/xylan/chitin deacetylase (PgdA/CDA1 family)
MPAPRTANPRPIPILMYHQIETAPPRDAPFRSLYVSPAAFRRQMALLKLLGYRGLSMSALAPYLRGEQHGKVVGLTFDDGYLNNLTNALPVLKAHGFSSTCYAVSRHLGMTNQWDHSLGVRTAPLMDASHLRQWIEGGQEVGAHTMHHARLSQLDAPAAAAEIFTCKSELERETGAGVRHFCYPYGDFTQEHVELVRAAGYDTATTTQRGRCRADDDLLRLPRITVARSTSLPQLWLKVATRYEDRRRDG